MNARKSKKLAALLIMSLALTAGTYAFAAANTVPASNAGDGEAVVSGYTVTGINYTIFADSDPVDLDSVVFTLTPNAGGATAGEAYVQLVAAGTWYTCTNVVNLWTCTMPGAGPTVLSMANLRIIASD